MIEKFNKFLEKLSEIELKYSSFDWDDNILHMSTVIHMDKFENSSWIPVDVSTSEFAKVRGDKENWRIRNGNPDDAFCEFRDFGPRGQDAFLIDTKESIDKGDFGPSWDAFIECLTEGNIFSIITARGHEPESIREGIEYIIDNILSDDEKYDMYNNCLKHVYLFNTEEEFDRIPKNTLSKTPLVELYLDNCDYYGVSSPSFIKGFGLGDAANPEHAKELALKKFIDKIHKFGKMIGAKSVSVGFSDDDIKNVDHVEKVFRNELSLTHALKYNIYNTNDRSIKGGERTKIKSPLISENKIINPFEIGNIRHTLFNMACECDPQSFLSSEEKKEISSKYANLIGGEVNETSNQAPGMESSILSFTNFGNMTNRLYPNGSNRQDDNFNTIKNQTKYLSGVSKELSKEKKSLKNGKN